MLIDQGLQVVGVKMMVMRTRLKKIFQPRQRIHMPLQLTVEKSLQASEVAGKRKIKIMGR